VDLVPAVAEHLDQEHLEEAVVADELEGYLPAFAGELLASVAVVLDQALGRKAVDHLADARRGDAQTLGQLAGRHGSLVAVEEVKGFEIILLRASEGAAVLDVFDHLGFPNSGFRHSYHKR
jgi:hypothetical protein